MATQESVETLKRQNGDGGSSTVCVASKLPFDIVARLQERKELHEPVMGGGFRKYEMWVQKDGEPIIFQGNSFAQNDSNHQELSFGFGITRDVPRAFWEAWLEQNAEAPYVKAGLIFAHSSFGSVKAEAREKEKMRTNLERLDPNHLPGTLTTSDEMRKAA